MSTNEFWTIRCTTGCSCCSADNHYYGIYSSKGAAKDSIARLSANRHVASQYFPHGFYQAIQLLGKVYFPFSGSLSNEIEQVGSHVLVLFDFDDVGLSEPFGVVMISALDVTSIQEGTFSCHFRKDL